MENKLKEPSKTSRAEIGQIMDEEMSSVEDILADLDKTSNGRIRQSIGNAVMVFRRDPVLKGAIRFNELTAQRDIVRNLGWERTIVKLSGTNPASQNLGRQKRFAIS